MTGNYYEVGLNFLQPRRVFIKTVWRHKTKRNYDVTSIAHLFLFDLPLLLHFHPSAARILSPRTAPAAPSSLAILLGAPRRILLVLLLAARRFVVASFVRSSGISASPVWRDMIVWNMRFGKIEDQATIWNNFQKL